MSEEESKRYWDSKAFAFFANKSREYYSCHLVPKGVEFNCLFCCCPLYMLGRKCGGNFTYMDNGIKDCGRCLVPHKKENYGYITRQFQEIAGEMIRREWRSNWDGKVAVLQERNTRVTQALPPCVT